MKSFGSVLAFARERNLALLKAFRDAVTHADFVRLKDIGRIVVNSPAPRFWVSEERAAAVVSAFLNGKPVLDPMRPSKREMFREIIRRVNILKKYNPNARIPDLVALVINSPAPKFYMEPSSALERIRIFKINSRKDNEQPPR